MFGRKKKEKKEKITFNSGSSSYNETTRVQTSNSGEQSSTTVIRQISLQSSQTRNLEERTYHHSSSAGSVPQLLSNSIFSTPQSDTSRWAYGTGSAQNSALPSSISRLPNTGYSNSVGTSSNTIQPRLSLPYSPTRSPRGGPAPARSAFSSTTFGSYPSRSTQSPVVAAIRDNAVAPASATATRYRAAAPANIAASMPARNGVVDVVPTYSNVGSKRGKALLINNIKFLDKQDERLGAEKDSQDLARFLRMVGFEVEVRRDMRGKDMIKKIETFSKSDFSKHNISMVVVMSHGNNIVQNGDKLVRVKGGHTEIAGIDNVTLLVDDIIEKFTTGNSHPSLKGKPKIFMFQCCRGEKDQEVCHDAVPTKPVLRDHSDILIAFSTLPGYLSNRNPKTGSWYIQSVCEVFTKHYKDYHIEDMLKIVDDMLSKKHPLYTQTSTYENRGFKTCYLFPRT